MAKPAIALGSVLGTIEKTANTITNVVGTLDAGVSMLNSYVRLHSDQQKDKHIIERATSRDQLLEESALVQAERRSALEARFADEAFKGHYAKAYDRLAGLFAEQATA
jgi:hypothetical protein